MTRDEEGLELPDLAAATREALAGARSLICEQVLQGRLNLAYRIEVAGADGAVLAVVTFADAVRIEPPAAPPPPGARFS